MKASDGEKKSSGKASQDGKQSSKGSGKGKKGEMFEVTEGDGEQEGDELAGGADQVTMVLTRPCERLLRWILHLDMFRTLFVMISFKCVLVAQLVSRHSCVADRLPVVARFPAGPRVSLKW